MQPCAAADGLDSLGREALIHGADCIGQFVVVGVDIIAELMIFDPMPQPFHDVQFRRVGRQRKQRDVGRNLQSPARVPPGVVQNKNHVPIRPHLSADRLQMHLHHLGVCPR